MTFYSYEIFDFLVSVSQYITYFFKSNVHKKILYSCMVYSYMKSCCIRTADLYCIPWFDFILIHFSLRAWDTGADLMQYEYKGVIKTQTRHKVPLVKRTTSIANILTNTTPEKVKRLPSIREPNSESGSRKNSYDRSVFFFSPRFTRSNIRYIFMTLLFINF